MAYRIIISGGGTGGHIFPAIAIANAIKAAQPDSEILFVGAEGRMEMEKVPQAGYKIIGLPIMGIQRRLTLQNLKVPFKIIASILKARKIIREFKPILLLVSVAMLVDHFSRRHPTWAFPRLYKNKIPIRELPINYLQKRPQRFASPMKGLNHFSLKKKSYLPEIPYAKKFGTFKTKKIRHWIFSN
jgi:UDP-N-acetylglucosamine--N-acetylmuramyl-(pentapeptide) pyrophosphoryl-undecaprenol N-acetylglucosamine transferase